MNFLLAGLPSSYQNGAWTDYPGGLLVTSAQGAPGEKIILALPPEPRTSPPFRVAHERHSNSQVFAAGLLTMADVGISGTPTETGDCFGERSRKEGDTLINLTLLDVQKVRK
jgi:hypothetical protein